MQSPPKKNLYTPNCWAPYQEYRLENLAVRFDGTIVIRLNGDNISTKKGRNGDLTVQKGAKM